MFRYRHAACQFVAASRMGRSLASNLRWVIIPPMKRPRCPAPRRFSDAAARLEHGLRQLAQDVGRREIERVRAVPLSPAPLAASRPPTTSRPLPAVRRSRRSAVTPAPSSASSQRAPTRHPRSRSLCRRTLAGSNQARPRWLPARPRRMPGSRRGVQAAHTRGARPAQAGAEWTARNGSRPGSVRRRGSLIRRCTVVHGYLVLVAVDRFAVLAGPFGASVDHQPCAVRMLRRDDARPAIRDRPPVRERAGGDDPQPSWIAWPGCRDRRPAERTSSTWRQRRPARRIATTAAHRYHSCASLPQLRIATTAAHRTTRRRRDCRRPAASRRPVGGAVRRQSAPCVRTTCRRGVGQTA